MSPPRLLAALLLFACLGASAGDVLAQRHRLLPTGDPAYVYLTRLQRRGLLLELHPTAPPYTQGEVYRALDRLDDDRLDPVAARWVRLLRRSVRPVDVRGTVLAAALEAGLTATGNDRRDVLRYTDAGAPTLALGAARLFPTGDVYVLAEQGRFVADLNLRFDLYYRDDPDALDAANRLITRNASYLGYDSRPFAAYLGRFDTHWSVAGEPALVVSDNPAPYDRLYLRLGHGRLALRSVLGELDNVTVDGRFTGVAGADSVRGSERRLLAAHRFDWRPTRHVALTFMEANLFSGPNAHPSLKYLNPLFLHLFLVDEPPKNEENNGLLAGMLWLYHRGLTVQGQLLVDDVDVLAETGEPASLALSGSVHYAGASPAVDLGARLSVVSSRAYNTHQAEGRYLYLLRGLGTQFNDYVHAAVYADLYLDRLLPGLVVSPQLAYLAQGEAAINAPYLGGEVPFVLAGEAERVTRAGAAFFFQRDPRFWLRLDAGVNFIDNAAHRAGVRETRFSGLLAFGVRLAVADALHLGLR